MRGSDVRPTGRTRRLILAAALAAGMVVAQSGVAVGFVPGIPAKGTGYKTPYRTFSS
jgi:hypothetical protein